MKIDALFGQNLPPGAGGASLVFQPEMDFLRTLTLGQIIKGRVLRSFEGSRYLMEFAGRERVVDSSIPLKQGEVVHGRVVGLGERVELRRIQLDGSEITPDGDAQESGSDFLPRLDYWSRLMQDLFERYQAKVALEDQDLLREMLPRARAPDQLALAAVILAKLGLRLTPEMLQALVRTLVALPNGGLFPISPVALRISASAGSGAEDGSGRDVAAALGAALQGAVMPLTDRATPAKQALDDRDAHSVATQRSQARHENSGRQPESWSRRILNTQTGGALAHRINTIPLLVNGRLVELDVALFEQRDPHEGPVPGMFHRQILFSLRMEQLGTVGVKATLTGARMRVELTASSSAHALFMSAHAGALRSELEALRWHVDELVYRTEEPEEDGHPGAVLRSVTEHIISPGSVSRWA